MTPLLAILAQVAVEVATPDLPPMPPDAPDRDEVVMEDIAHDAGAVVCANWYAQTREPDQTLIRVVVTHSMKWGTVWRADWSVPLDRTGKPMFWRTVCSGNQVLLRPLDMFDPAQSIEPLK